MDPNGVNVESMRPWAASDGMLPTPLTPSDSRHDDRSNRKQTACRHNRPLGLAVPLIRVSAKD
jgi:hypothetical protein